MYQIRFFLAALLLSCTVITNAQERVTTVGLQFKPILSSEIINTGPQSQEVENVSYTITPQSGYAFGMVIRKGLTKQVSLETGINYSKKNFGLKIADNSSDLNIDEEFSYVIYEIPITGLVYVQLGRELFLNTSFGLTADFLPSDWQSGNSQYYHRSFRTSWVLPSLIANLGFEYRTADKGFYYLGFSYKRPFTAITTAKAGIIDDNQQIIKQSEFDILGNYLTIDLKYFFHENPERKTKRRK
ncbi:MAG: hypothetical protein QMC40_01560 [Vicingaceae bacterium]|tara:strand:+ start:315 stop:1043 length:729 start_codon:yes stop_codon:yes gene_type:complete